MVRFLPLEELLQTDLQFTAGGYDEDGKGRIDPSLRDEKWKYERAGAEKGRFEVIYAGGAGAMQAFGKRIDQDQILKIMAFTDSFGEGEGQ